jgi:IS6 family transposase
MPLIGGFRSFRITLPIAEGFKVIVWLQKCFWFSGARTVREQNRLLGICFRLQAVNKI